MTPTMTLRCLTTEQSHIDYRPFTSAGVAAVGAEVLGIEVLSGAGTFELDAPSFRSGLCEGFTLIAGTDPGATEYLVETVADFGAGEVTYRDVVALEAFDPSARARFFVPTGAVSKDAPLVVPAPVVPILTSIAPTTGVAGVAQEVHAFGAGFDASSIVSIFDALDVMVASVSGAGIYVSSANEIYFYMPTTLAVETHTLKVYSGAYDAIGSDAATYEVT